MMLALRIRQAEVAVKDGRLDEAYQQAVREDVREHRKGQRLITRLTKAFENRARKHLNAGNPTAAMADADRATRLAGNQTAIVAIKDEARRELNEQQHQQRERRRNLDVVRNLVAAGNYTMGAKVSEDLRTRAKQFGNPQQDNTLYGIMQDAELERQQVESLLARGQQALKASLWDQALDVLDELRQKRTQHAQVPAFTSDLVSKITPHIRTVIDAGRLDQAGHLLQRTLRHASTNFELTELAQVVEQCRTVADQLRDLQAGSAVEGLKSLEAVMPRAKWLTSAIREAETMVKSLESLRTGPLGNLRNQSPMRLADTMMSRTSTPKSTPPRLPSSTTIPEQFLLHLDEAGSFLVIRSRSATIGKLSMSTPVDVALQSHPGLPRVTIERTEDDYFLTSDQPVKVDGKQTTSALLNNGSQVRLGRRGALDFSIPNAASTSAAIDVKGIRTASGHIRRIILMDDDLVIGPQASAHIRSTSLASAKVLHYRDGELRIRPMVRAGNAESHTLAMESPHDVDGLSLVITDVA